jgi:hypothetical protein
MDFSALFPEETGSALLSVRTLSPKLSPVAEGLSAGARLPLKKFLCEAITGTKWSS